MKDLESRSDLEKLMRAFYTKLFSYDRMREIFFDVANMDLEQHLPHIVDFWDQNIFRQGSYKKNVMQVHLDIHAKTELGPSEFKMWLNTFYWVVDEHFAGPVAETIKTRALSIATVMQIKMQPGAENKNRIY